MVALEQDIDRKLKQIVKTLPSEDLYFEAIRDIIKDLIKEYLRKQINQNAELRNGIVEALKGFIEAKVKEYDSMARMAKVTASLGLLAAPESLKTEALSDFMNMFQKEIEEIIKRTF